MSRPRIRTIKPELWQSRDFRALSSVGRLTFLCLIGNADDEGRLKTDAAHLSRIFIDEPVDVVAGQLEKMEGRGMIVTYGGGYLALCNWHEHQKTDHARPSELPIPPKFKRRGSPNKTQLELEIVATPREPSRKSAPSRRDRGRGRGRGPETEMEARARNSSDVAAEVFAAWQQSTGSRRAVLDDKRRRLVAARLKEGWSVDDLLAVVSTGWRNDPWNERPLHNQIEILLRDSSHVEKFVAYARNGAPVVQPPKSALELSVEADLARAAELRERGQ